MKIRSLYLFFALSFFYLFFGLGYSIGQEYIGKKINKNFVKDNMNSGSLTIIFSHQCGYCLLLNKFFFEEKICEKYQASLNIIDVTYLDLGSKLKEAEAWNNYPVCSKVEVLEKGKYKVAKLRPILFYKNRKGRVKKIMGFDQDKLISLLQADLPK